MQATRLLASKLCHEVLQTQQTAHTEEMELGWLGPLTASGPPPFRHQPRTGTSEAAAPCAPSGSAASMGQQNGSRLQLVRCSRCHRLILQWRYPAHRRQCDPSAAQRVAKAAMLVTRTPGQGAKKGAAAPGAPGTAAAAAGSRGAGRGGPVGLRPAKATKLLSLGAAAPGVDGIPAQMVSGLPPLSSLSHLGAVAPGPQPFPPDAAAAASAPAGPSRLGPGEGAAAGQAEANSAGQAGAPHAQQQQQQPDGGSGPSDNLLFDYLEGHLAVLAFPQHVRRRRSKSRCVGAWVRGG